MKVEKIIDPEFKSGVSAKTGKSWTLVKVELEDGTTATGFAPVSEGDEVEVSKTEYGLQFKVKSPAKSSGNDDTSKLLNMIYQDVQAIKRMLEDSNSMTKDVVDSWNEKDES